MPARVIGMKTIGKEKDGKTKAGTTGKAKDNTEIRKDRRMKKEEAPTGREMDLKGRKVKEPKESNIKLKKEKEE